MQYYLYQITNKVNGKIYVGVHKTSNLDDGYMGSGRVIQRAIEKHGIENFTKDILEFFENAELMYAREKEIVTEEFLARDDVYNLRRGGHGGFDFINSNALTHIPSNTSRSIGGKNSFKAGVGIHSNESKIKANNKLKETCKGVYDETVRKKGSLTSQSESANEKRKLTLQRNNHQQGEKNSQFGTMWITDGCSNKKIKKTDDIPDGWCKGRI